MNPLFVACRSDGPDGPQWGPIGRLERLGEGYRFVYTEGARMLKGFFPLVGMPDLEEVYDSDTLFPLFSNRLLARSRPEYDAYLAWSGFDPKDPPDPIAILSVTEGRRATDQYEVFPCPVKDADSNYRITFFVHGMRHLDDKGSAAIQELKTGDRLGLRPEGNNPFDRFAIEITTASQPPMRIGYVPRYLAYDAHQLCEGAGLEAIAVRVKRVNRDAPLQQRMLCEFTTKWPADFEPCQRKEFRPIPSPVCAP